MFKHRIPSLNLPADLTDQFLNVALGLLSLKMTVEFISFIIEKDTTFDEKVFCLPVGSRGLTLTSAVYNILDSKDSCLYNVYTLFMSLQLLYDKCDNGFCYKSLQKFDNRREMCF